MKLYGHTINQESDQESRPVPLSEVTLWTNPKTLRKLSEFILMVADQMDEYGSDFGHEHFEDYDRCQPRRPGFIVMREPTDASSS